MSFKVVIPARYASSRFPGKPLAVVHGRTLLEWVYRQACRAGAEEVLVATDHEQVAQAAIQFGAQVVMTAASHASGTDRIAEVARLRRWPADTIVVNVQGDEPLLPPALVLQVAEVLAAHPGADIATLCSPIGTLEEFLDPNVVKLVTDARGRALYFSRAAIPFHRDGVVAGRPVQFGGAQRHIGIYAYRAGALARLAALPAVHIEEAEKLEQLRALVHGMQIHVAQSDERPGPDVNSPEDLARVAPLLLQQR